MRQLHELTDSHPPKPEWEATFENAACDSYTNWRARTLPNQSEKQIRKIRVGTVGRIAGLAPCETRAESKFGKSALRQLHKLEEGRWPQKQKSKPLLKPLITEHDSIVIRACHIKCGPGVTWEGPAGTEPPAATQSQPAAAQSEPAAKQRLELAVAQSAAAA